MTFLIGIIGLGFLVFFHELGHFLCAKSFGVKVESFSVGMGPILFHKTFGGTDYRISLIPLGGYCAMKGEKDFQKAIENNLSEIEGSSDSFYGIHPLKRLLIAFAGPFANVLLAFIAFFTVALTGYTYYSAGCRVSMADEKYPELASRAHEAGMMTGDEILSINGQKMNDFSEIAIFISTHGGEDVAVEFLRNGETRQVTVKVDIDKENGSGKIGIVSDPTSVAAREYPRHTVPEAFAEGFSRCGETVMLTFKGISTLFKGINVMNAVSGPARITEMLGSTVSEGFSMDMRTGIVATLEFLALISISLFLTNLLPIPVLDGALILFAFAEFMSGRKINPKILYYIQFVGIAIIACLTIFALTGDFIYFMKK